MILSASRRTDIPRYYMDWLLARLEAGYALVRNPMNPRLVSRVDLSREVVDCIVFWTKSPAPLLERLGALSSWPCYVQFSLHPYGRDMEAGLPPLAQRVDTFRRLAEALGPERMVWRYSPLILSDVYTESYHVKQFNKLAIELEGSTTACKLSFVDLYRKIRKRMDQMALRGPTAAEAIRLAHAFTDAAAAHGITIGACGNVDLQATGLARAKCIDKARVERIIGGPLALGRDPNQRKDCYCDASVDIGVYDSCLNGCVYCYANHSPKAAQKAFARYNPASPLLCGELLPGDKVVERTFTSNRADIQLSMF